MTYTTAHGNTGSLTHWARPEMEPTTSWFLVRFVSTAPWWELPDGYILKWILTCQIFFVFLSFYASFGRCFLQASFKSSLPRMTSQPFHSKSSIQSLICTHACRHKCMHLKKKSAEHWVRHNPRPWDSRTCLLFSKSSWCHERESYSQMLKVLRDKNFEMDILASVWAKDRHKWN